jgi:hypothetical protein
MKIPTPDEAMFSGPLGEIVKALDPYTEGSRVGVLGSLISAFSANLGHNVKVQASKGLTPLSVWTVLVGVTGQGRKGTATNIAMRVVESAFAHWADHNVVDGCPATGLGFIGTIAERAEERAATPMLFIEEELDAFISNCRRDARIGTYLRKAWDGSDLAHKTSQADIRVKKTHVGFIGHVQPKNWGAISGSKDATGGTWNRFLPLAVERSKVIPVFSADDPTEVIREQGKKLRGIASLARDVDVVTVSKDTADIFEKKHRPACEALISGNEELAQMSERALAYLVRLAALYALADIRDVIEVADFDAALALIKYSVETVVNVLPEAGGDRLATKIADAVREAGEVSRNELRDYVGYNVSQKDINQALLCIPQIQQIKGKSTGGRPPVYLRWIENEDEEVMVS